MSSTTWVIVDTLVPVRWDALFADLEAQLAAEEAADLDAEVAERARIEAGRVAVADRLRGHVGGPLTARLVTGATVRGRVLGVASDVVLIADEAGRHVLVPLAAVAVTVGLTRSAVAERSLVRAGIGVRHVLRGLARERRPVRLETAGGDVTGMIVRVGADHVDVDRRLTDDDHDPVGARGAGVSGGVETVMLAAIVTVRPH